jgi:hypothetical protein
MKANGRPIHPREHDCKRPKVGVKAGCSMHGGALLKQANFLEAHCQHRSGLSRLMRFKLDLVDRSRKDRLIAHEMRSLQVSNYRHAGSCACGPVVLSTSPVDAMKLLIIHTNAGLSLRS